MRVLVTRPGPQAGKWVAALRSAGLDALALPLIEIAGPPQPQAVLAAWQCITDFDALMFVSANAVDQFFALRPDAHAAPLPPCWVTGPGSVAALQRQRVPDQGIAAPDHGAAQFDSEALWQVVHTRLRPGGRVLIVRGNSDADGADDASSGQGVGREWFAAQLRAQGQAVEFVVSYARRAPHLAPSAQALLQAAAADGSVWLFSSSEAVRNLCALVPAQSWAQARAVATHPRIAQAARAAGFAVVCESRPAVADLVASIESLA